jgi:hypothetical protein
MFGVPPTRKAKRAGLGRPVQRQRQRAGVPAPGNPKRAAAVEFTLRKEGEGWGTRPFE